MGACQSGAPPLPPVARQRRDRPHVAFDRFWSEVGDRYSGTYRKTVWAAIEWLARELGPDTLLRHIGPTELLHLILRRANRYWEQELPNLPWG
jgi:hypothetical protein